jgi:serine/threonine protein kinase
MPEFAAPETVSGDKSGLASDMWSLGVITYLLLSGRSPFRGRDDAETMDKIKSKLISYEDSKCPFSVS